MKCITMPVFGVPFKWSEEWLQRDLRSKPKLFFGKLVYQKAKVGFSSEWGKGMR